MAEIGEEASPSTPASQKSQAHIPIEVRISFWIWITGALLNAIPIAISFRSRQAQVDELRVNAPSLTPAEAGNQAWVIIWIEVAIYALIALLFVVFALKMRAGRRSARILLPVLAILNIAPEVFTTTTFPAGWFGTAAGVTATVLMFVTPANAYFRNPAPSLTQSSSNR